MRRWWLAKWRIEHGLTQEEMAARCGLKRVTYAKVEYGKTISVETAQKISRVVGVPWPQFFEDDCPLGGQEGA